jgi:hypothetical protein
MAKRRTGFSKSVQEVSKVKKHIDQLGKQYNFKELKKVSLMLELCLKQMNEAKAGFDRFLDQLSQEEQNEIERIQREREQIEAGLHMAGEEVAVTIQNPIKGTKGATRK